MIGESILSLLIVETTEATEYYAIALLGCLTVIVLQMLKYESEPAHADGHALWRSMTAAIAYRVLLQVLSMSLIAFGVSYKLMLKDVLYSQKDSYGYRRLGASDYPTDEAVAWLFCSALFAVLLTLELIMISHSGFTESYNQLFRVYEETLHVWSVNWPMVITSMMKVAIFACTITLALS